MRFDPASYRKVMIKRQVLDSSVLLLPIKPQPTILDDIGVINFNFPGLLATVHADFPCDLLASMC